MEQISTKVAEYSATEAALAELAQKYKGATFDVTVKEGMKLAKAARHELRTLRTALEAKRVEIKAPVLLQARLIDAEAQRITKDLLALEEPIDIQVRGEEQRIEAARKAAEQVERERIAGIEQRIADLEKLPAKMVGQSLVEIAATLEETRLDNPEKWAQELLPKATFAHRDVLAKLEQMHAAGVAAATEAKRQAEAQARLDAERAAFERQQKAAREAAEADARAREEAAAKIAKALDDAARESRERIAAEEAAAKKRIEEAEAKARAERQAEEAKLKAERDKLDADRRAKEEAEHQAKLAKEREAEAQARAERERVAAEEERQRQEKLAEQERERQAREVQEAAEREERRQDADRLDARQHLQAFVDRWGNVPDYGFIVVSIRTYLDKNPARKAA